MTATATRPARTTPVIALEGATKRFGAITALEDVDLDVHPGECHAVVGENGAGKSTLMKILAGVHQPDAGRVLHAGEPVSLRDPRDARERGVSMIHQELALLPQRTVAENVFLGREPRRGPLLDRSAMHRRTAEQLAELGLDGSIDPRTRVADLAVADQQMVEVARALAFESRVVIMDEPTAPLAHHEAELLFERIGLLLERDIAVLYVSHRLEEVLRLADRITVLKDGRHVQTLPAAEADQDRLVHLMVGRELGAYYPPRGDEEDLGGTLLSVRGGGVGGLHDLDLQVRAGEVVGLAGLQGAGRTEVLLSVFGITPFESGEIDVLGRDGGMPDPRTAVEAGVGLVPEDRKAQGLALERTVRENLVLPLRTLRRAARDRRDRAELVARVTGEVDLRGVTAATPAANASGGNQQKIVVGKWLAREVRLLLLDEPTRGIDVGAKAGLHELIRELAREGLGILMVSSELPEVLGMSDRIVVMREGTTAGELPGGSGEADVMRLATGGGS